jgi:hypothetical protein
MLVCTHALREYACEQRTATTCAMNFAQAMTMDEALAYAVQGLG